MEALEALIISALSEMTAQELNQYLENIAKLIESAAKDTAEAAKIVRESKIKA